MSGERDRLSPLTCRRPSPGLLRRRDTNNVGRSGAQREWEITQRRRGFITAGGLGLGSGDVPSNTERVSGPVRKEVVDVDDVTAESRDTSWEGERSS